MACVAVGRFPCFFTPMKSLARRAVFLSLLLGSFSVCRCYAAVLAQSSLFLSDLQITPASGSLLVSIAWYPGGAARADGFSAFPPRFDGVTPLIGSVSSTFATASFITDSLRLTEGASSMVNIPGETVSSSFAAAESSLHPDRNLFMIIGGTGPVDVTFSATLTGTLNAATEDLGVSAMAETEFRLNLDGSSILFRHDLLSVGPKDAKNLVFETTLTATRTLQFGSTHYMYVITNAESRGASMSVPESTTFLADLGLVAVALILLNTVVSHRKLSA
jgi:hypothetical protein